MLSRFISAAGVVGGAVLLVAAPAAADRIPAAAETEVSELPLRADVEHLTLLVLRQDQLPLVDSDSPASPEIDVVAGDSPQDPVEGEGEDARTPVNDAPPGSMLSGLSPWQFFDGTFDEGSCRAPRVSQDGYAALAICGGLDQANPRDEHVVLRRGRGVFRYPLAVARGVDAEADLSSDGERFTVLVGEGGSRTVHLVDLLGRQDHRIGGGWREPGNPLVAGRAMAVAFTAQVGGEEAVVVANLDDAYARLAWREGRSIRAVDLSEEGRRVLLIAKTDYLQQLFLVDVERGSKFDLSGQKGDVEDAQLHPAGDLVVFSSAVGGVCAVWWVDMTLRRRKDMLSSVEGCYGAVRLESSRRLVLYENVVGLTGSTTVLYDRKTRQPRPSLPAGCRAIELSGDGRYTVARCSADPRGSGLYLFATPEEE